MNAEDAFVFTDENIKRVKDLLVNLKSETLDLTNTSELKIFDILASIIIEGLQYSKIIPYPVDSQLEDITKQMTHYSNSKKIFLKFISNLQ
jgi:hypothetical protein